MLKWGNSLAVRLPRQVAVEARLQQGDRIRIEVNDQGTVQIRRRFPTLDELVARITPRSPAYPMPIEADRSIDAQSLVPHRHGTGKNLKTRWPPTGSN